MIREVIANDLKKLKNTKTQKNRAIPDTIAIILRKTLIKGVKESNF
jgi:hypothetical protein